MCSCRRAETKLKLSRTGTYPFVKSSVTESSHEAAGKLMPKGLIECRETRQLPKLGDVEFVLLRPRRGLQSPVSELSAAIVDKADDF